MDSKSRLLTAAAIGYLLVSVSATADLSCQVQRTISQPVTGGQCPNRSVLRLCPNEVIMCSCLGQEVVLQWINSLFTDMLSFINTGPTTFAPIVESSTGACTVATVVNPRVNITSDLTLNVTTTATVNVTQFNNTAIRCEDTSGPAGGMEKMIFLFAPPPAPAITAVSFTAGTSFTIEWSEPPGSCEMVDGFDSQLSPNDLNCMMSGMTYTCSYSETHLGQTYTFTVSALNCGIQTGEEASVSVNLQAPNQPTLTAIPLYNSSDLSLLEINSTATVVSQVFIADGVDDSPTEYIFTYDSGSESLQFTRQCTGSSCQHTFSVPSSSQVQQYTVSVAVRNVVGVGTASAPVTIDSHNNIVDVIVDVRVPEVICQFQNGPVASATCTIEYGNDPTYMNLPNFASSTGTNITSVTIPLSVSLQRGTLYYYVVSTMGVRIHGRFRTVCVAEELGGEVDTTPDSRCLDSTSSVQISNGVACYNDSEIGSDANYFCHCAGLSPRDNERRVCQPNGFWNGRVPQCDCSQIPQSPSVDGGELARNDCVLLEYNCPSVAFGAMSGTLQYNCTSGNWSTDLTSCSDVTAAITTSTIIIIVVVGLIIIVAVLVVIDSGSTFKLMKADSKHSTETILKLVLILTVVGIPFAIAILCYRKTKAGQKDKDMELKEPSPGSSPAADSGPLPVVRADPNDKSRKQQSQGHTPGLIYAELGPQSQGRKIQPPPSGDDVGVQYSSVLHGEAATKAAVHPEDMRSLPGAAPPLPGAAPPRPPKTSAEEPGPVVPARPPKSHSRGSPTDAPPRPPKPGSS